MSPTPSAAFVTIATDRYVQFVAPLLASCRQFFLTDWAVTPMVPTDRPEAVAVETHRIEHAVWPSVTLRKFGTLARFEARLASFDYVYLCDADMRFVAPVGREVLGELTAAQHPGFFDRPESAFSYERRPESAAYVAPGLGQHYYSAAFVGGSTNSFMAVCREIHAQIEADLGRGIVALWHDESHLNRYLVGHPPTVILSPAFCYPEDWSLPFEPRLMALEKDHLVVRHGLLWGSVLKALHEFWQTAQRGGRVLRRAQASLRKN